MSDGPGPKLDIVLSRRVDYSFTTQMATRHLIELSFGVAVTFRFDFGAAFRAVPRGLQGSSPRLHLALGDSVLKRNINK